MKVLVVSNMFPTEAEPWFGCFVKEQVEDLRRLGVDVEVFHFDGRREPLNYPRAGLRIRSLVEHGGFDLLHAHYGLSGAVALGQRRLPVLTTFHGTDTGYVRWQGYVSWLVARTTMPIFVSDVGARLLGVSNPTVIPTAVDTERFAPIDRVEARLALGWDPAARYVLLPGSRKSRVKRADLFDAAVRETGANLTPVSLEGFSRSEAVRVMNAVDLTLMTSDSEGSPVAVKESLACETPVVSVDVGDVADVIRRLPGCSVRARDPQDLALGVLEALTAGRDPVLRERALEYARPRIAARVAAVYDAVAAGRRS